MSEYCVKVVQIPIVASGGRRSKRDMTVKLRTAAEARFIRKQQEVEWEQSLWEELVARIHEAQDRYKINNFVKWMGPLSDLRIEILKVAGYSVTRLYTEIANKPRYPEGWLISWDDTPATPEE